MSKRPLLHPGYCTEGGTDGPGRQDGVSKSKGKLELPEFTYTHIKHGHIRTCVFVRALTNTPKATNSCDSHTHKPINTNHTHKSSRTHTQTNRKRTNKQKPSQPRTNKQTPANKHINPGSITAIRVRGHGVVCLHSGILIELGEWKTKISSSNSRVT